MIRKIKIVSDENNFLRNYLKIIRPISKLTEGEEKAIVILEKLCRLEKTKNLFRIVKANKPMICEQLGINQRSLATILSSLRKKQAIIDGELNPNLVLFDDFYNYENLVLKVEFNYE